MKYPLVFAVLLTLAMSAFAQDKTKTDWTEGALQLLDGTSTLGWDVKDEAKLNAKKYLELQPKAAFSLKTRYALPAGELLFIYSATQEITLAGPGKPQKLKASPDVITAHLKLEAEHAAPVQFDIPAGATFTLAAIAFKPSKLKPIFDGKTLDGWKLFKGEPKRELSKFDVSKDGELQVKNGPGDLQTTKKYDNFLLQLDCKTNGKFLNSGIFFRCMDGQYQNGYECQIQNAFKDNDRTKPLDFGTGAIYRRQAATKIVANDLEWFTLTLVADGDTFATWVNGTPVLVWKDERPKDENPRKGLRLDPGHLSIQGHDPTTDILFKNFNILELKRAKK